MPDKHEHHGFMVAALAIASVTLIAVIIIFAYRLFIGDNGLAVSRIDFDDSIMDESLEEQQRAIQANMDAQTASEAIEQFESDTLIYQKTAVKPGFHYPKGWSTYSSTLLTQATGNLNTLMVDDQKISVPEGADGTFAAVTMHTWSVTPDAQGGYATRTEYILQSLDQLKTENVDIQSNPYMNGTLTTYSAQLLEGLNAPRRMEIFLYETPTTAVEIHFDEINEGTQLIKSTLDFSSIQ